MAATGNLRGHAMYFDGDVWRYLDTDEATAETYRERNCGHCDRGIFPPKALRW